MCPMLPMLIPQIPRVDACNDKAWDDDATDRLVVTKYQVPPVILDGELSP